MNKIRSYKALFIALSMCIAPATGRAEGFSFFATAQLDQTGQPAIRINTNVTYGNLVFLKKADLFESKYQVIVRLLDGKDKLVDSIVLTERVVVGKYEDTKSRKKTSSVTHRFLVEPGDYVVQCRLRVENTHLAYEKQATVNVPDFFQSGISITEPVLFATHQDTSRTAAPLVRADDFEGTPNDDDIFTAVDQQPALRFDVYTKDQGEVSCQLVYEILDGRKSQILYGRKPVALTGQGDRFVLVFNVDAWDPGDYTFRVKAVPDRAEEATATTYNFSVEFTRSMLLRNFDKTIEILSLIGTRDEVKAVEDAAVADRADAWLQFWKRRDPTPETERNEALEEHMRRVRYVVTNFSGVEPGWRTDRGKVYIRYGKPDEVEVRSDPYFQGEYLIWRYIKENLSFVFYDRFGLGEYKLTNTSAF